MDKVGHQPGDNGRLALFRLGTTRGTGPVPVKDQVGILLMDRARVGAAVRAKVRLFQQKHRRCLKGGITRLEEGLVPCRWCSKQKRRVFLCHGLFLFYPMLFMMLSMFVSVLVSSL